MTLHLQKERRKAETERTTSSWWKKLNIHGLVLTFCLFCSSFVVYIQMASINRGYLMFEYDDEAIDNRRRIDSICPAALNLFPNTTILEESIQSAKYFHQQGGNLIAIENYLNGAVQSTLDRLDLKFEFNDGAVDKAAQTTSAAVEDLQSYYETHTVPRGGYGQPLPGKLVGNKQNVGKQGPLFSQRWVNVIEGDTADRFRVAIGNVGPECAEEIHFAEGTYEGKVFCVPPSDNNSSKAVAPTTTATAVARRNEETATAPCNIFSIGSNDQWGFEEEVVQKLPNCVTHTFDCTLQNNRPRRKPASDNVRFYPYCIGSSSSGGNNETKATDSQQPQRQFLSYYDLWKQTKTTSPPKLLKIDVEGFEFGVIPAMLRDSPPETWPEQITMEVHWATRMVDVPSILRTRTASEISLFFGQMFNQGGYLPVKAKYFEPGCSTCLEVLMVRVLCQ